MPITPHMDPDVVIFDDLDPESAAMVLAMYSRDPRSVRVHLEHVKKVGPKKFMSQFYVGYGHKSIGDCGSTTVCAEYVSMLAAKAIQQHALYNGQEASTRYLDMSTMPVLNPLGTDEGLRIQERWMSFYGHSLNELVPYLTNKYPRFDGEDETKYAKAVKVKAFDIARAFLPAGCTTFVGWHTNLRQAWDHLKELLYHPLQEVQEIGLKMLEELKQKYPSSFDFRTSPEKEAYHERIGEMTYTFLPAQSEFEHSEKMFDFDKLSKNRGDLEVLYNRPQWTELPYWFRRYGQLEFSFLLDFGSFRDVQRQRSSTQIMPLLTTAYDFHPWYLESLPPTLVSKAKELLFEQQEAIRLIEDANIRQYYIAMGYQVACEMTAPLPAAVYIAELRAAQTVHSTLRQRSQQMGEVLKELFPTISLYCDMNPDEWSIKRGGQDIIRKK